MSNQVSGTDLQNLFHETSTNNSTTETIGPVTLPNRGVQYGVNETRRVRRCRCCGAEGHDRRTCPDPTEVERRRLNRIARAEQQRLYRQQRQQRIQGQQEQQGQQRPQLPTRTLDNRIPYKIINNNDYPMYIYWSYVNDETIKYTHHISEFSETTIKAYPSHRLVFIPVSEITLDVFNSKIIHLPTSNYFIAGDFNLSDFEDTPINIIKEYKKSKTELEQWKECGLKSLFLLKELKRMGATKYDNLEPLMDMVQDIKLPTHSELDKELAGVPSAFTNIT